MGGFLARIADEDGVSRRGTGLPGA